MNQKSESASFVDCLKSLPLYVVPHHLVSRLILKLTRMRFGKGSVIRWFIKQYNVDLTDAVVQNIDTFEHFNAFFTRELTQDARPIAAGNSEIACPADGRISAVGHIEDGRIFQAKGHDFTLSELLGGDDEFAAHFRHGEFTTIYLSPRDYHRVHMPIAGQRVRQTLIPGRLFSVGPHTVRSIPRLFARNERLVVQFDTAQGAMAIILVGAINVGAIETVWDGLVTPPAAVKISRTDYQGDQIKALAKGAEMGRFNMGSTVIVLLEHQLQWLDHLQTGTAVKMGQALTK